MFKRSTEQIAKQIVMKGGGEKNAMTSIVEFDERENWWKQEKTKATLKCLVPPIVSGTL